ncbi:MAG: dienelactone hydrolase family protein [Planctomycetes bacterium]|nr:dienelactone hydrolase family protein [Planctomycetota bacterium]
MNPKNGSPKAGVILVPKRWVADAAALHSARALADVGFACRVLELSSAPRSIDDVTSDEIVAGLTKLKAAEEELRKSLGGKKKVGAIGAWIGGTMVLQATDKGFDACVVVCPFITLPVADDVMIPQPLDMAARAKCPILAVFGERDGDVPLEDVRALEKVLSRTGSVDEAYTYPGVGHAFFDNEPGNKEYREPAERDLWMRIERFFTNRIL